MNKRPHVVKFSGGRSSGMMLIRLLEQDALDPQRGDVIVFNNTSAEHSATYEFTRKIKILAEEKYNIPFFWIEYQTYEDSNSKHQWSRKPTYRLVNERPCSEENKNGYHYKGEVFEELISVTGHVPNMFARTCTTSMKIFITNSFLSDWFAQKQEVERLGHHSEKSRMNDGDVSRAHKKSGGAVPEDILLAKRKFVRESPFVRDKQVWADFTKADIAIDNKTLGKSVLGGKSQLYGELAIEYVSYLGIRKDEEIRIRKIKARIDDAKDEGGKALSNQPPKEKVIAPLVDENVTQQDVVTFWNEQQFNLALPDNGIFSNCVYCPLKGKDKLLQIATEEISSNNSDDSMPESIDWWIKIEEKYSRNLVAERRSIKSEKDPKFVGFFGAVKELIYPQIKQKAIKMENVLGEGEYLEDEDYIPCNCTD